jgi:hypothetical protein
MKARRPQPPTELLPRREAPPDAPITPEKAPDREPTSTHFSHYLADKNEPRTWYSEKNRLSLGKIQIPVDKTTEYYFDDTTQNSKLMMAILIMLLIFLAGVFL